MVHVDAGLQDLYELRQCVTTFWQTVLVGRQVAGDNVRTEISSVGRCVPQKQKLSLSGLLHQAILMMQAAKHRRLHNTVTGGQLVSVVAGRNIVLVGLRNSRT